MNQLVGLNKYIRWIAMAFCADIHVPQRMSFTFSNALVCDEIPGKLMKFPSALALCFLLINKC